MADKRIGPSANELDLGCQQLKRPSLSLCSENKRKKAGSFVRVKHRKRAWQTKELGPLPLSLTWGCQQLKRPGLSSCSESKRKKAGSFVSVKHGKRAWQTNELVRSQRLNSIRITSYDNILQQLCPCRNWRASNFAGLQGE